MMNIINSFIDNGLIQVRKYGENAVFQITNEINSSQISPSKESSNGCTENAENNHVQENEEKTRVTLETLESEWNHRTMNKES